MQKKKTPKQAREKALWLFTRTERPVLVGHLALELPYYSLVEVEGILLQLVTEGLIRLASEEEKQFFGIQHGFVRCKNPL